MLQAVILVPNVEMHLPTSFSAYISVRFARDLRGQQDTASPSPPFWYLQQRYCLISVFFRNTEMTENAGSAYCGADLVCLAALLNHGTAEDALGSG